MPPPRSASFTRAELLWRHNADAGFATVFAAVSYGYPLLWMIGLGGLYWPILGVVGTVYMLRRGVHRAGALPLAIGAVLVISMPIGVVAFGLDMSRIASLGGNVLVWLGTAALVTLSQRAPLATTISRAILVIGLAQGVITAVAHAVFPLQLPVPLIYAFAWKLPSGLGAFAANNTVFADWLDGSLLRSHGLMAQATWAGLFGAITCLVALSMLRRPGGWRWVAALSLLAGAYSLSMSLSRSTEIALGIAAVVGGVVLLRGRSRYGFQTAIAVGALSVLVILVGWADKLVGLVDGINGARAGSLDARESIYARTWELIGQLPVPVLGYGIKPQENALIASVGTHSTYLGLVFRGGIVAVALFVALLAYAFHRAVATYAPLPAALIALVAVWCVLEDFDPGHLAPLAVVLAFAMTVPATQFDVQAQPAAHQRPSGPAVNPRFD